MRTHMDKSEQPLASTASVSRRQFLKSTAFVGGCAALAAQAAPHLNGLLGQAQAANASETAYKLAMPENLLYSSCLQCHVSCQIKAKIWDGTLAKLSGNPYSPQNFLPHIDYATRPEQAAPIDAKLCAKGQSGIQTYYDPYRIRKVLKRAGGRGSNQWKSIPFDQFIKEVVAGGKLFTDIGDDRHYPGFDEVVALRDAQLAKSMAEDAGKFGKGELSLADFKTRYADHLDVLIDPDHPDLGPKNNGFVFMAGRIEHGRKEIMKWFTNKSLGSPNAFEHTTICEQSHHIAYAEMTGHGTHHMKPDLANAEFVIFWGTGAFTANFGLTPMAEKVTTAKRNGRMKTAVVDARLSNDAGKADWWLPVQPNGHGALAMAMIRWILENNRYDQRYLENANKAAAEVDGEPTWSNAAHLVKIVDGHPFKLLRADEAGVGGKDQMVVSRDGQLAGVDPNDKVNPVEGDLLVTTTINGIQAKSAFQLLTEEAFKKTLAAYAKESGVELQTIIEVARELTAHGKRAAVDMYRGPVQQTDGYYSGCLVITLNVLVGNADYKGGLIKGGGHWHEAGGKEGNVYNFAKMHPGALKTFGPKITREQSRYEDYSLFREKGYPARRPWYPFTGNVYQEIIPSFAMGYPYPGKILLLHKGTPALSIPGGNQQIIDALRDPQRVPLFIASDIVIGESSMYADYIVPDLTYLERWGMPHPTPDVPTKASKIRQPVAAPLTEAVAVGKEKMPICLETFLIAVATRLQLSGFGKNAFGPGLDFMRVEDWFLKEAANLAYGDKTGEAVPDADDAELALFHNARRHLPASVFDESRWKKALRSETEWRKAVYVLNRGGRFDTFGRAYQGEKYGPALGKMFHLFVESVASQKNSISGNYFSGVPIIGGETDAAGKPLERSDKFPFSIITYKDPWSGHSRTISNYWANISLQPENKILINSSDARRLGLKAEQKARLVSADNPKGQLELHDGQKRTLDIVCRVEPMEGIRPGTIAVSWHYGHWAYGSHDVVVDDLQIGGDKRRAGGICTNHLLAVDPVLGDICLTDPIGGSASFSNSRVNLIPVV
ncbi:MAG: molybdopterin-dependent oxidoreductase [Desulfosarcinaceae bacterium]